MGKGLRIVFLILFCLTYFQGNSQIAQRGAATYATTTNTTLAITKPSGLVVGDVMIVQIVQGGSGSGNGNAINNPTATGWTAIAASDIRASNGDRCRANLFYKIAVAADVSAANFNFTKHNKADNIAGALIAFSGIRATDIFDVTPGTSYDNISNDNQLNANLITTVSANSAVIMFGAYYNNSTVNDGTWNTTSPGSLAELYDVPFNSTKKIGLSAAWAIKPVVGPTGNGTATLNNSGYNGAILIALKRAVYTAPNLSITTGATDHGSSCVGQPAATIQYTVSNIGTAASGLTVTSNNPQFVVSGAPTNIAAGGTATYDVTFIPSNVGLQNATITVASISSGSNSPTSLITGTGINTSPTVSSPSSTGITSNSAILGGNVSDLGCSNVNEWGIYYSISDGFADGTGTKVSSLGSAMVGAFTQTVSGLSANTTYYFKAFVTNAGGTYYTSQGTFSTSCVAISTLPYTEDFSSASLPTCWQNIDILGSGQIWQFQGNPVFSSAGTFNFNSTSENNGFAILNSDQYGNGSSQNADLISPTFDFTTYSTINLEFVHFYEQWNTSEAILSYSIDGGSTWTAIQVWDSDIGNATTFNSEIAGVAGQSNVQFKWNFTGSWEWYWIIDDILITGTSSCNVASQNITGGGNYCAGDAGVSVGIAGSEIGVTYQLYRDGSSAVGTAETGTGSAINFGLQTVAGTYTVVAHHIADECNVDMSGSAIVVVNPVPTLSGVSQDQTACSGNAATINLSGLIPNSTFSLNYSIDNVDQTQIAGVVADAGGDASFTTPILSEGDDGKLLRITAISITDILPNCSQSFTQSIALDVQPTNIDVVISANPSGTVCPGSTVTYTASSVNGGSNPSYQWKVNGNNVGTNSNAYSYTPEDGDQITCSMTSDATCADGESTIPVSFFSWNDDSKSLTDSDYGIDASSINDGQYLDGGVDGTKCLAPVLQNANIMLTFDGTHSELNTDGADYQVSYRRAESNASMFTRGSSLGITAGAAFSVSYLVDTGTGSSPVSSPSFNITDLDNFHDYRFKYNPADGYGRLYIDGLQVWQSSVPTPGMPMYWTGAGDLIIGVGMDASGNQTPTLDNLLLASIQLKTVTDTFNAVVGDTEKPTITCPADIFVDSQDSICGAAVSYITPSGTDNCSGVTSTLIEGLASGDTFQVGSTVVSYEIADESGNKDTCSFTVTVADNNPPTFKSGTYPDTISVANTPGLCGKIVTFVAPTASDFCNLPTVTRTSIDSSGMFFPIGSTPVTFEAIDLYGNMAFDTIYVNVYDAEAPTIDTCPEAIYSTPFDTVVDINTFIPMVANDNCSGATINYDPLTLDLSFPNVEIISNIASDLYGNTDTCSFVLTVQENSPIGKNPDADTVCAGTTIDYNFNDTWGSKSKWIVNGPDATISDPNSASTEITFNVPGVYTIRAKIQESGQPTFYNDFMVVEADDGSAVVEVTIAASPSVSVCNGTEVTFTATPINGGATPGYKWLINGAEVSGETDPVLVRSTLTDGDLISCEMTSSLICVSNNPDTSNTITISIDPIPTVTLESNTADACYADGTASLNYSDTSGGANRYSIDYTDGTIPDVNNAPLSGGSIALVFPTDKNPGTYSGTLTVNNSVTGCISSTYLITIEINELPASGEIIPD